MSLRDEIQSRAELAIARLNAAHNYYAHSLSAWRLVQAVIDQGDELLWDNPATASVADSGQIESLLQKYMDTELTTATFLQFVSIFENFLFDVLRLWLTAYPDWIARRQITGREIIGLPDKGAIIDSLVEKELRDVFYDRPARWFEYLDERIKLGLPSADERLAFAEIKATRDVLVHGLGVASPQYVDKAGPAARAAVGELLDVPEPYHYQSWIMTLKLAADIGAAAAGKA